MRVRAFVTTLVLVVAACAGAVPARADAQERVTCGAVDDLGSLVRAFLTGAVGPGDALTLQALASSAAAADHAARVSSNGVLSRAATDAALAARGLRTSDGAPAELVQAVRTLVAECESLGVDLRDEGVGSVAADLVLRPADLPGEWVAMGAVGQTDERDRVAEQFNRCVGVAIDERPDTAEVASQTFLQEGGVRQVSSAVAHVGATAARAAVERFARRESSRCMTELLTSTMPGAGVPGLAVVGITTEPLDLGVPSAVGLRSDVTMRLRDAEFVVHIDNVVMARDDWFARVFFVGAREPLDRVLERSLLLRVHDRLAPS